MKAIAYSVLFHVTCPEEPQLKLVGVCNYDLYVTVERMAGIQKELKREMNRIGDRFDAVFDAQDHERAMTVEFPYVPIHPSTMSPPPEPGSSALARLPKNINTCINICMKGVHQVLYDLTKPVG